MLFLTKIQKTAATVTAIMALILGTIGLVNTIFGISELKSSMVVVKDSLGELRTQVAVIKEKVDNLEKRLVRYESKLDNVGIYATNANWLQRVSL